MAGISRMQRGVQGKAMSCDNHIMVTSRDVSAHNGYANRMGE